MVQNKENNSFQRKFYLKYFFDVKIWNSILKMNVQILWENCHFYSFVESSFKRNQFVKFSFFESFQKNGNWNITIG